MINKNSITSSNRNALLQFLTNEYAEGVERIVKTKKSISILEDSYPYQEAVNNIIGIKVEEMANLQYRLDFLQKQMDKFYIPR